MDMRLKSMGESFEGRTIIIHLKLSENIRFDITYTSCTPQKFNVKQARIFSRNQA